MSPSVTNVYLCVAVIAAAILPCARAAGGQLVFCKYPASSASNCEGSPTPLVSSSVEPGKCYLYPEAYGSAEETKTNGKSFCVHSYRNTATSTSYAISHMCPKAYAATSFVTSFDVAGTAFVLLCGMYYDSSAKTDATKCKWTDASCDGNHANCGGCFGEMGNCTKSPWGTYAAGGLSVVVADHGEKVSVPARDSQHVMMRVCMLTWSMYCPVTNALKSYTHHTYKTHVHQSQRISVPSWARKTMLRGARHSTLR